jgi:type II secretory pathway pseudopilin PulG
MRENGNCLFGNEIEEQTKTKQKKVMKRKVDKGITLVALVITIIVLLILAGVTIATLTGNNGILTRAKEAKIVTEQANLKEELTIAMANYEIAKSKNEELTLADFLQNTEQSGLTNINIIEQTNQKIIGSYQDHIFIVNESGEIQLSTTPNLVNNGLGENKNNTNFSQAVYQEEGYFSYSSEGRNEILSDDYIPVDTTKTYYQMLTAKSTNPDSIYYIGFKEYDEDKLAIGAQNYLNVPNSLTYLEKELKKGDTEVYLHDASGFVLTDSTPTWQKGFIFWNYQNQSGYQYPELTYSQNVFPSYDSGFLFNLGDIDLVNHCIHLKEPWNYPTIPKGTKLSQRSSGSMWNYGLMISNKLRNNWTVLGNTIQGVKNGESEVNDAQFRPGTKYIKFFALVNYLNDTQETHFDFKNVIFTQMD